MFSAKFFPEKIMPAFKFGAVVMAANIERAAGCEVPKVGL